MLRGRCQVASLGGGAGLVPGQWAGELDHLANVGRTVAQRSRRPFGGPTDNDDAIQIARRGRTNRLQGARHSTKLPRREGGIRSPPRRPSGRATDTIAICPLIRGANASTASVPLGQVCLVCVCIGIPSTGRIGPIGRIGHDMSNLVDWRPPPNHDICGGLHCAAGNGDRRVLVWEIRPCLPPAPVCLCCACC